MSVGTDNTMFILVLHLTYICSFLCINDLKSHGRINVEVKTCLPLHVVLLPIVHIYELIECNRLSLCNQ
jgi:hypothetical protein